MQVLRSLVKSLACPEGPRVVLKPVGVPDVTGAPVVEQVIEIAPDTACAVWTTESNNRSSSVIGFKDYDFAR